MCVYIYIYTYIYTYKVFLLAAVTAIKIMRQQMLMTASFLKCF